MEKKLIKEISFKDGKTYKAGEMVEITPNKELNRACLKFKDSDKQYRLRYSSLHLYFKGFKKMPTMKTIEKQFFDGVTTTPTGKKVELDGYDSDGFPSWFIILNIE